MFRGFLIRDYSINEGAEPLEFDRIEFDKTAEEIRGLLLINSVSGK